MYYLGEVQGQGKVAYFSLKNPGCKCENLNKRIYIYNSPDTLSNAGNILLICNARKKLPKLPQLERKKYQLFKSLHAIFDV